MNKCDKCGKELKVHTPEHDWGTGYFYCDCEYYPVCIPVDVAPSSFVFSDAEHKEVIRIETNGDFYIKGKLVTNDLEIYKAMVRFLQGAGCYE